MEYRMYSMVLRQLTPIQKGIQSAHAVVDYARKAQNESVGFDVVAGYAQWADTDKTLIVLDAGTSQDLEESINFLKDNNIVHAVFKEPDLYGMPTAVCFLADERVWNCEAYPDYEHYMTLSSAMPLDIKPGIGSWIVDIFDNVDPKPILNLREFIFSKKLSQ